jgi:hypothetical protein
MDIEIDVDEVISEFEFLEESAQTLPMDQIGDMMVDNVHQHDIPIRTGQLYESIEAHVISNEEVSVQSPLDYAVYVDEGTYKMEAHPFAYIDDYLGPDIDNLICDSMGLTE